MDVTHLLLATLLVHLCFLTACSHWAPEEKPRDDRSLRCNSSMNLLDSPPVSIVALNKKSRKISIREVKKERSSKKKASTRRWRAPDPPPVLSVVTRDIAGSRRPPAGTLAPSTSVDSSTAPAPATCFLPRAQRYCRER